MIRSVYIIGVADNPVKIGIAANVQLRLSELQIGCPDELKIHHVAHFPDGHVQAIETACHQALAEHHRRGEWFNVTATVARETLEQVAPAVIASRPDCFTRNGLFQRVDAVVKLSPWAPAAIAHLQWAMMSDSAEAKRLGDRVVEEVGAAGLATLRAVIVNRHALDDALIRDPRAHGKALRMLGRAINALTKHYRVSAEDDLLSQIEAA